MKLKLKLLNVFYLIFSIVAIAVYVLSSRTSFMSATFEYKVNTAVLVDASIDDEAFEELGIKTEDLFSDYDEIKFEIQVNLTYTDLLRSWTETGTDYDYVDDFGRFTAIERYSRNYILTPAFSNAPDYLYEVLQDVARTAIQKMIENKAVQFLTKYSYETISGLPDNPDDFDLFQVLLASPDNTDKLNKDTFLKAIELCSNELFVASNEEQFQEGKVSDWDPDYLEVEGLKRRITPYFEALKKPSNADEQEYFINDLGDTLEQTCICLHTYGVFDENGDRTLIDEAIGTILQHLIDHNDYEAGDNEDAVIDNKFVNKFFAPLKSYIEEDSEFEDEYLTELMINVIKNSNLNGGEDNNRLFYMFAFIARVFGALLVLFVLSWAIKLILCFISFFRQKPYLRINPFFIITGTLEALLALVTLGSFIIFRYFDINSIRTAIPVLQNIIPIGLRFQFIFVCWIPGILAIMNLLLSIVYGPVKKKFKQDSRDEILYSTDFNDYE